MDKLIAIDPGKYDIKAGSLDGENIKQVMYRSRLYTLKDNEHFDAQGNSKFITYKNKQYIIGDQGQRADMSLTKSTILHKVGLMAALSELVEAGDIVKLVLGCPASIYKDKTARQQYKEYMTDAGILEFNTASQTFNITVASTWVLPEAGGTPFVYPELFKDARVGVVDIGGLNLNFSIFNNGIIDLNSMRTVNHGGYTLETMIQSRFSGRFGVPLDQDAVEKIMQLGYLELNGQKVPESKELLESIYQEFIAEIPNIIRSFDYDLSLLKVLFIGGTSKLLGDRIKDGVPHAEVYKDANWVNIIGFLKMGKEKYKM